MSTPSQRETREVHNHGTEDGPGLACRERMVGGRLVGDCLAPSEAGGREVFNEQSLRAEIVRVWGPAGAHVDVFDTLLARLASRPSGEDSARMAAPAAEPPAGATDGEGEPWPYGDEVDILRRSIRRQNRTPAQIAFAERALDRLAARLAERTRERDEITKAMQEWHGLWDVAREENSALRREIADERRAYDALQRADCGECANKEADYIAACDHAADWQDRAIKAESALADSRRQLQAVQQEVEALPRWGVVSRGGEPYELDHTKRGGFLDRGAVLRILARASEGSPS